MGSCFSVQLSGDDQTLIRIFRFLCGEGYIRNLKENLRDLEREMEDLKAVQDEVRNKVAREERQVRQRLGKVKLWLTRVEKTDTEVNHLLSISPSQLQNLCLCDLLSKKVCSSYDYGKSVFLLLEDVKKLKLEGKFEVVADELTPLSKLGKRTTQPTIGQDKMLNKAWNRLMQDEVVIMGLHGMGGVGKTTLFKKIHDKFTEMATFDEVIWIVVSQGASISKLQEDIAKKLYICGEKWSNKNESDKAEEMQRVLQEKRFVLMLDDIWEEVDLAAIGVPIPTIESGSKVAFTTRSQQVCGRMGDHAPMQVNCLEQNEAWELFKTKVGDDILRSDPVIAELARKVAGKCRGLPLALNVIGKTMASKTMVQEWEHAVDVLTRSAAEFDDMENKILSVLKYSYDSLGDEHIKSCFLYCALFPEDCMIEKENLTHYWLCEGFIGRDQVLKTAKNEGYVILGILIRANLLTEDARKKKVVMHDVVREMALWIACDLGKRKETFVVQASVGLHEIPKVKEWGAVRRMSLIKNSIEEMICGSKCSELTTLFLQNNKLKNFSGEFISSMQKLVVLDLSDNYDLNKLPEQISELASLQYLDLSYTSIEQLPVGFQELKKLTHLYLISTRRLCSIRGISMLSSLKSLKLQYSNVHGDVSLVKELQLLKHLQVLTITISTQLCLEQISNDQRLAKCIIDLDIQETPLNISVLVSMENLCMLDVGSSHVSEINTNLKCIESNSSYLRNPTNPCFTNLFNVLISNCHSIKDLTWILYAPNLAVLSISHLREVEEIINEERATSFTGVKPFEKLSSLILSYLPKLRSIYWSPLLFPLLRHIRAQDCPVLRKLPFNSTSVPQLDRVLRGFTIDMTPREQKNDFVWEDEDTKNRFLPIFYY